MSSWQPSIAEHGSPKFLALAEALQKDISEGRLTPGTKLPPYRELAVALGMSPGTVNKAYLEAERRGLVQGEVGRGTFVLDINSPSNLKTKSSVQSHPGGSESGDAIPAIIDLSVNMPPVPTHNFILAEAFSDLAKQDISELNNRYLPYYSHPRHREASSTWLKKHGMVVDANDVVLTNGAQHAMSVAISTVARPGDLVFTDQLTYPGMKSLASHLGLKLEPVKGDGEGMLPDALSQALQRKQGKAVYLMPTLQNPTGQTMGEARRRDIAKIAEKHGVYIVEDDIYGLLCENRISPIRNFAPDHCFYLTSMSKSVIPGLRVGFLVPPRQKLGEVNTAMRATGWTAAPLMVDVAANLILDCTADRLADQNRKEALVRQKLAREFLGSWLIGDEQPCYHTWLDMPKGWGTEAFISSARSAGVIVTPTEGISVGQQDPGGARLCLGAATSLPVLQAALRRLQTVLQGDERPAFFGLT
ncbi:PLP-dependent aminotransferase family protein [Marinibacterium sp. SX1]|uniref:aminotransferase-like domain-containing protein n=1 Tax=Marinibacterium sp. SX1 TaxID=3388424 RepID=UPI003D16B67D